VWVIEDTSAYWRVLFENPPSNILDATVFEGLQDLVARMGASPSLRAVEFESANPEFYVADFDLTGKTANTTTAVGPSGLPILMNTFVRLTKSTMVSIANIPGLAPDDCSSWRLRDALDSRRDVLVEGSTCKPIPMPGCGQFVGRNTM
jgi:enoyl-CoA hydratase/carnithine racemase